jgi:hypothetical protein
MIATKKAFWDAFEKAMVKLGTHPQMAGTIRRSLHLHAMLDLDDDLTSVLRKARQTMAKAFMELVEQTGANSKEELVKTYKELN